MPVPYEHAAIEQRWQARWADERVHEVDPVASAGGARRVYNLVEFPYPSAEGLHIGHALTYSGADVWGRYQRRRGHTVFQPIGFDAFGINAENYALRVGEHPRDLMARTTANYRRQLTSLGCAWSWDATFTTSDPDYYRWTQWVFLRLFEAGLAYRAVAPVLWCRSCRTVLAREQVEEGRCERCATEVVERTLRQWFLRTTAYAQRLLDGLATQDWPTPAKNRQRAWIGRDGDRLQDWLISRQRYWGPPIPIVHCDRCGEVPVPDDELPVLLPDTDDPAALLAGFADWVSVPCPRCGGPGSRDTDVSDTFLDSSWYYLRFPSADVADRPWDPDRTARWLPVDQYAGGPEHVTRHHLYARFVCMALHDLGLVPFAEPFPRLRLHGMLTMGGAKMSKSRGNVVNPDEMIAAHGADVTRLALLFTRPWDADGDFDPAVVVGVERFLARTWRIVTSPAAPAAPDDDPYPEVDLGPTIDRVTRSIERMQLNTAIAALMTLVGRLQSRMTPPSPAARSTLVGLLAPFAPHVAEELWRHHLGHTTSVHVAPWPASAPSTPG
ncbi:MAG TPA: class I tRNA ligase family protein [Acidimicrobiales bacterium]|nr:class I tRNA ligase family protein [Acidimicrobiales bacterium]